MAAPLVEVARETITAPFCAPLLAEMVILGAAAAGVTGANGVVRAPSPPHPYNKPPAKIVALTIEPVARIFEGPQIQTGIQSRSSCVETAAPMRPPSQWLGQLPLDPIWNNVLFENCRQVLAERLP
jgi:hypothetical protein